MIFRHFVVARSDDGLAAARAAGYTHVLTVDADDALDPRDIERLVAKAREHPKALVLGERERGRRRFARRVANFFVHLECGRHVADSTCPVRLYPLDLLDKAGRLNGWRGFESEVIVRAAWTGLDVVGVPLDSYPPARRTSPGRLLLRTWMHAGLLLRALSPWRPATTYPRRKVETSPPKSEGVLRAFWNWINPIAAWRQVRTGEVGRTAFAAGFALGVFIANLPVYGFQTLLCLYSARRLHLHPISVIAGSHVATPPLGPALIACAIAVGHLLLHGSWPTLAQFDVRQHGLIATLAPVLLEWAIGAVVVGIVLAVAAFTITCLMFRATMPATAAAAVGERR